VAFIFVSPLLGFLLGSLMMVLVAWVFRRTTPSRVDKWFRRLQLVSAGAYSLGHGGNDAQKTIGIIWMLLIATGYTAAADKAPPGWVIIILLHRPSPGHHVWRLAHRQDHGPENHQAQAGGRLLRRNRRRDHAVPGHRPGHSGVHHPHHHRRHRRRGLGARASAVRWGVAGNIVWAWIFTIPASAFVAAVAYWVSLQIFSLNSIETKRCRDWQRPADHVANAVQVKAVQAQRAAQKGQPRCQGFVFHADSAGVVLPAPMNRSIMTTSSQRPNFQPHDCSVPTRLNPRPDARPPIPRWRSRRSPQSACARRQPRPRASGLPAVRGRDRDPRRIGAM
jgi:hypothetical protein